ncbi:MAG TPA: hypothetical protein V6D22_04590, partial [Candidatus Obscuribacterales bacterium]
ILKATERLAAFPLVARESEQPSAIFGRAEGAQELLASKAGVELNKALAPAISELAKTLSDPEVQRSVEILGKAAGDGAAALTRITSSAVEFGAGLTQALEPLGKLAQGLSAPFTQESRVQAATAPLQDAIDRLSANRSQQSPGAKITGILNQLGLEGELGKISGARSATGIQQLSALNLLESTLGGTKEFQSQAPDFFSQRQASRQSAFDERTKAFGGGAAGTLFASGLEQSTIDANIEDASKEAAALRDKEAQREQLGSSREDRLKENAKQLAAARRTLSASRQIAAQQETGTSGFADVTTEFLNATGGIEGGRKAAALFGGPAAIATLLNGSSAPNTQALTSSQALLINNQRQADVGSSLADVSRLEGERRDILNQQKSGDAEHLKAINEGLASETKILALRNQAVTAAEKQAQAFGQLAESAKNGFVGGTTGGNSASLARQGEFLGKALGKQNEAITDVDKLLSTVNAQEADLKKRTAAEKDPAARKALEEQSKTLEALASAKGLERQELGFGRNRIQVGTLEVEKAQLQSGAIPLEQQLSGVDRGTFGGAVQASKLEEKEALVKANAAQKQIDALTARNAALPAGSATAALNSQFIEKLTTEKASQNVLAQQANRAGVGAQFARQSAGLELQRALSASSHAIEDEITRRKEASDALQQSRNALADFDKSLEAARADKESGLVGLAAKIKSQGGSVLGNIDTSPEALKQAQLGADVARFNQQAQQAGLFATASGGARQGFISAASPFSQDQEFQRDRLQGNVLKAEENEETTPLSIAQSQLDNQRQISDLSSRLGVDNPLGFATEAGLNAFTALTAPQTGPKGAPGFGIPSVSEFNSTNGQKAHDSHEAVGGGHTAQNQSNQSEKIVTGLDKIFGATSATAELIRSGAPVKVINPQEIGDSVKQSLNNL